MGMTDTSHYLSSLYGSTLSTLSSCCCACGNMLWQDLQCATNTNRRTHILSIPNMSTTPTLCQPSSHQLTHEHKTQIHTYLLWPSNSPEPEPSSQQRQSEWWIRARIREERKTDQQMHALQDAVSKLTRTLNSKEPCQRRCKQSFSFNQMIMITI